MTTVLMRTAIVAVVALFATTAAAQYPTRPIKLLVPIPPGGAPDIAARVLGQSLGEVLGQPVVVENRPGANGNIASEMTVRAPPDGYTLLLCADSQIVINPHLYAKMGFDTLKDLAAVATVASNDFVLSVNPALPVKNFVEFIEYARKANPPLAYASGGNGSQHHLTMEMLKARAGIDLVHVPYRGGTPAATATVAGEVAAMFSGTSSAPQIRSGNLRALAMSGRKRSLAFPELPTIGEFYPGFSNSIWLALFAPAGTPAPIMAKLHAEVNRVLAQPDVKEKFNRAGVLEPYITTPEEFAARIRADDAKYAKIVKDIGATVD
ncbi:MAG: tripartite tricarboxylate transporter substrate binding protein [Proteobacteria bacterium]|nr:tripartite tricarboxylate transporter substrate binding protein [Pseudomonadota bacterium]